MINSKCENNNNRNMKNRYINSKTKNESTRNNIKDKDRIIKSVRLRIIYNYAKRNIKARA